MGAKGDLGEELRDEGEKKCPDLSLALKTQKKSSRIGETLY